NGVGRVLLEGEGDPADGLRALCAVAWSAAGDGRASLDAEEALARLDR
ncbi:HAD family hydrolase, partial [Streptomyces sp. DJ]